MIHLITILSYVAFVGCEFSALCVMTRGGRGRGPRILGLVALATVDVAMECVWQSGWLSRDVWLAVQFTACWGVLFALTLWLSGDSIGHRLFLALAFGTYALGYSSLFDAIVCRPFAVTGNDGVPDSRQAGLTVVGLAAVVFLNFAYIRWILPRLPRDGHNDRWHGPCLVVGVMFAAMFASCRWPISIITAPIRDCVPFVLVSVAAWIVFPMACGRLRDRRLTANIAYSLDLMMAEVKERRVAIDLARRLRHDQRHHRVQIAEYMLAGQYDRVFDYLKALDEEAQEAPTDKFVWCENETVNAILSGAYRQATAKGVELNVTANVERAVGVSDIDLVALLANLLENAIAAVAGRRALPDGADAAVDAAARGLAALPHDADDAETTVGRSPRDRHRVSVTLRQREHGLGITVTNPVPPSFALSAEGFPCAEPGVGLESVRRVVKRHSGQWSYELEDGLLKCRVILMFPIP